MAAQGNKCEDAAATVFTLDCLLTTEYVADGSVDAEDHPNRVEGLDFVGVSPDGRSIELKVEFSNPGSVSFAGDEPDLLKIDMNKDTFKALFRTEDGQAI